MFSAKVTGSWDKTIRFLEKSARTGGAKNLDRYGQIGVRALAQASPEDTGQMGRSWEYKIVQNRGSVSIEWYNTDTENGANVAILVQYGHGTGTGGYVQGRDFINPAMRPIFDEIAQKLWKEVTS